MDYSLIAQVVKRALRTSKLLKNNGAVNYVEVSYDTQYGAVVNYTTTASSYVWYAGNIGF